MSRNQTRKTVGFVFLSTTIIMKILQRGYNSDRIKATSFIHHENLVKTFAETNFFTSFPFNWKLAFGVGKPDTVGNWPRTPTHSYSYSKNKKFLGDFHMAQYLAVKSLH